MSNPTTSQQVQTLTPKPQSKQIPSSTLSTKNLINHYFLLHDFLLRMVKSPSNNAKLFDLQIQVNDSMRKAAKVGGKTGQIGMFTALLFYCMKGNTIKLKLLYGFLYMYWIQHFYTLGSYAGVLIRMPSIYKQVADYYLTNEPINDKNVFIRFNNQMSTNYQMENTQQILNRVFKQQLFEQKSYIVNEYFTKNKEKYFTQEQGTLAQRPDMKLKYMDCFLTRYVYYSFKRWYTRKMKSVGLLKEDF